MKMKINKYFLKVVQDYALSLTSTISVLSMNEKRLQSLSLDFDRVYVYSKNNALSGHWGVKPYL